MLASPVALPELEMWSVVPTQTFGLQSSDHPELQTLN
jgi:hypothetical protein